MYIAATFIDGEKMAAIIGEVGMPPREHLDIFLGKNGGSEGLYGVCSWAVPKRQVNT